MRRVERPDVALGIDAAGRVEVVVDHVVRGVGEHQADHGQQEQPPVDRRAAGARFASTASSPPMSPDQMVIGKTAARVMTSHLPTVSSGRESAGWPSRGSPSRRAVARGGEVSVTVVSARCCPCGPRERENVLVHDVSRSSRTRAACEMHPCRPSRRSGRPASSWYRCRCRSWRPSRGATWRAAERLIGATVPAHMPDDLEHFLAYRIADLSAEPSWQPWLGRAIVLEERGIATGHRLDRLPRAAGRVRPGRDRLPRRAGIPTPGRGDRGRPGRCSTGRGASTASPGSAPRPRPRTSPRRRCWPGSASAETGVQMDETTGPSSSSSARTGRPTDSRRSAGRAPRCHHRDMPAHDHDHDELSFETLAVHAGPSPTS